MTPHRAGLLVSTIFHLAVVVPVFFTLGLDEQKPAAEQNRSLSLHMFAPQSEPAAPIEQAPLVTADDSAEQPVKVDDVTRLVKDIIPETTRVKHLPSPVTPVEAAPLASKPQPPQPDTDVETAVADQAAETFSIQLLEQQYADALKQAIEARKFYPSRARRRAREGDVVVAFTVSRAGDIAGVHVVRSSRVRSLDRAAVMAVNRVGSFEPFPVDINREHWRFEIALSYHLQ